MRTNKAKSGESVLKKKYWVVRYGDTIELRASIYPLKQIRTKITKTIMKKERSYQYDYDSPFPAPKVKIIERPVKLVLEQTYFEGGKVLAIYSAMYWPRVVNGLGVAPLKADSCIQVTREVAEIIRNRRG